MNRHKWAAMFQTEKKGVWFGTLFELVAFVLAAIPGLPNRPFNRGRIRELFNKQQPGLLRRITSPTGAEVAIRVHRKPFVNWVRRNALQLLESKRSRRAEREHAELMERVEEDFEYELKLAMDDCMADMDFLDHPVEALSLSPEQTEALKQAGIAKIANLLGKSPENLLAIKGIGPPALDHIREQLYNEGLHLRGDQEHAANRYAGELADIDGDDPSSLAPLPPLEPADNRADVEGCSLEDWADCIW